MVIKVGCCGFPTGMSRYFQTFEVVEVQKTFYKPPSERTAEKWRKMAPENFEFTVKAWQVITHPPTSPTFRKAKIKAVDCGFFKPIREVFEAWEVTRNIAKILRAKFILFQTPKSFKDSAENMQNMRDFFNCIERDFIFGFEPRGWREESIEKTCRELDLVHVVDPFVVSQLYGEIVYFRLHGFNYKHKYTDEELEKLAEMVDKDGYVMFNNIHMFDDAMRFRRLIEKRQL
ncbi:DUF72 domain-containing protein [Archaeoglobus neptunius]|uniref:DUF72 domain-containing protein n=1 Tax=Archaeoglobus neptunius TaxID=2798580 RepID=UPI00192607D2|nr:DUF72 domain-containing protein [Archaeoglobus neptunius]